MKCRLVTLVVCLFLGAAGPAYAQGAATTSTLSGVVVDSAGGVVPGADVTIRHNATGVTQSATSNAEGAYSFPSLPIGTYTVTVTLQGFKTFVATDVVLTAGSPASVRALLEVGKVNRLRNTVAHVLLAQSPETSVDQLQRMILVEVLPLLGPDQPECDAEGLEEAVGVPAKDLLLRRSLHE